MLSRPAYIRERIAIKQANYLSGGQAQDKHLLCSHRVAYITAI